MLKFYKKKVFYWLMNFNFEHERIKRSRHELLSNASSDVLEIGFGDRSQPELLPGFHSDDHRNRCQPFKHHYISARIQIQRLTRSAEAMTFPDGSFDSVVSTFTLCSIPNIQAALSEIKRVLKPRGKFLFLEHAKSPSRFISGLQNLVNPFYNLFADGWNVNRDIVQLIRDSALDIQAVQTTSSQYRIAGFCTSGIADKKGALC